MVMFLSKLATFSTTLQMCTYPNKIFCFKFIHGRNLFTSGKWPLKVEVLSRFKVIRVQPVDTDKKSTAIASSHPVCLSWINSVHTEMLTVHC